MNRLPAEGVPENALAVRAIDGSIVTVYDGDTNPLKVVFISAVLPCDNKGKVDGGEVTQLALFVNRDVLQRIADHVRINQVAM